MSAGPQASRRPSLPYWFSNEDMLRRILLMRTHGYQLNRILAECGISKSQWGRLRSVAKHPVRPGDALAARAFIERFEAICHDGPGGITARRADLFTKAEGKLLAEAIRKWKIEGPPPEEE